MYERELAKFVKRCTKWFKNETIIYPNNIDFVEFPQEGEVTEIQKQRFNSQFEFFNSSD